MQSFQLVQEAEMQISRVDPKISEPAPLSVADEYHGTWATAFDPLPTAHVLLSKGWSFGNLILGTCRANLSAPILDCEPLASNCVLCSLCSESLRACSHFHATFGNCVDKSAHQPEDTTCIERPGLSFVIVCRVLENQFGGIGCSVRVQAD